jgi:hypothetical protein
MSVTNFVLNNNEFKDSIKITDYFCDICDLFFTRKSNLNNHFNSTKHKKILENPNIKIYDLSCDICNLNFNFQSVAKSHFLSKTHKIKLERVEILNNTNGDECSIPLRNIDSIIVGYTIVDKDIYSLIMNYAICLNEAGYAGITVNGKKFKLHRYIYYELQNRQPLPETDIDHMDRKKLNNKLCNLQEVSHGNNGRNKDKKENCTSKYHGVSKHGKKWNCQLKYNNISHSFYYDNELHAAYHHDLLVKEFGLENHNPLNNVEYPIDFIIKTKPVRKNGLPKNIYTSSNNPSCTYSCKFNGKLYNKSKHKFKTIEEAVLYRDTVLEIIKKEEIDELNKPYEGHIKRNSNLIAMMDIINDKRDIVGETLLDDDIYCYIMKHKRNLSLSNKGYANIFVNGKKEHLHRFILDYSGPLKVDHRDGNRLNNQKFNLRISTDLQNTQNRGASKNSNSKYVGICYNKYRKKWQSYIEGEDLGYFDTEKEAVIVRNKRAQELNNQGAIYRIEIYDRPTKDIENCDGSTEEITDSEDSTEENEIYIESNNNKNIKPSQKISADDQLIKQIGNIIINEEYIMTRKKVIDVKNIVKIKKLNIKNGGQIRIEDINSKTLDKYKKLIIDTLYPQY